MVCNCVFVMRLLLVYLFTGFVCIFISTDMVSISHYKLVIDHAQNYNRCRNAIFDVMPDFNNVS